MNLTKTTPSLKAYPARKKAARDLAAAFDADTLADLTRAIDARLRDLTDTHDRHPCDTLAAEITRLDNARRTLDFASLIDLVL